MKSDLWARLKPIFESARELELDERDAAIDESCGDDPQLRSALQSLLAAYDEAGTFLEAKDDSAPSDRIGNYRLLAKIGEGGMGEVWDAEQLEPVRRKVALKLLKSGMNSREVLARFEVERQALALMDHPHIAHVFDAGTAGDGRPYFAMEVVDGSPITEYCDGRKLDVDARLELFVKVCHGVEHAHQKGVVHRDIKPSNVLVTVHDGVPEPKIIDFGVAKAMAHPLTDKTVHTEFGQLIGTPEYMSPEQAELTGRHIDTRTDVYSLGVLLYELLTGVLPFEGEKLREAGFDGLREIIRDSDPPTPSRRTTGLGGKLNDIASRRKTDAESLSRRLRGDLDWIVMRALEKDPNARYGSPSALAADIGRHLRDEPVEASPPSALYRARKFVRRHRTGVVLATTLVTALLVLTVSMSVQTARVARERDRAEREAETAKQVTRFLTDVFEVARPGQIGGQDVTAEEILDAGSKRVDQLTHQPLVQAELMDTIGNIYIRMGLYDEAERHLRQAYDTRMRLLDGEHADVAESLSSLGYLSRWQGNLPNSIDYYGQALEIHRSAEEDNATAIGLSLNTLGIAHAMLGEYDRAAELLQESWEVLEQSLGPDDPQTLRPLDNLANVYSLQGRNEEAVPLRQRSIEVHRKAFGESHLNYGMAVGFLATTYKMMGRSEEAEPLFDTALRIRRETQGANHPDVAIVLAEYGDMLRELGRLDEAEAALEEALRIHTDGLGRENPMTAEDIYMLGNLKRDQGRFNEARDLYREALTIWEAVAPNHPLHEATRQAHQDLPDPGSE